MKVFAQKMIIRDSLVNFQKHCTNELWTKMIDEMNLSKL